MRSYISSALHKSIAEFHILFVSSWNRNLEVYVVTSRSKGNHNLVCVLLVLSIPQYISWLVEPFSDIYNNVQLLVGFRSEVMCIIIDLRIPQSREVHLPDCTTLRKTWTKQPSARFPARYGLSTYQCSEAVSWFKVQSHLPSCSKW